MCSSFAEDRICISVALSLSPWVIWDIKRRYLYPANLELSGVVNFPLLCVLVFLQIQHEPELSGRSRRRELQRGSNCRKERERELRIKQEG